MAPAAYRKDSTAGTASVPEPCFIPAEPEPLPYRPGEWYRQHHAVVRYHGHFLGPECLALYGVFASHANAASQQCWVTIPTMMQETGMGRNRVRKALRRLETYTLIRMEWRLFTWKGKTWWGYLITLLDPNPVLVSLRQASRRANGGESPAPLDYCTEEQMEVQFEEAWGCELDPQVDLREGDEKEEGEIDREREDEIPQPEPSPLRIESYIPEPAADSPPLTCDQEPETTPSEPSEQASGHNPAPLTRHASDAEDEEIAGETPNMEKSPTTATPEIQTQSTPLEETSTQSPAAATRTPETTTAQTHTTTAQSITWHPGETSRQQNCPHPPREVVFLSDGTIVCNHCYRSGFVKQKTDPV
jgi:hypothetical protein